MKSQTITSYLMQLIDPMFSVMSDITGIFSGYATRVYPEDVRDDSKSLKNIQWCLWKNKERLSEVGFGFWESQYNPESTYFQMDTQDLWFDGTQEKPFTKGYIGLAYHIMSEKDTAKVVSLLNKLVVMWNNKPHDLQEISIHGGNLYVTYGDRLFLDRFHDMY